MSITIQDLQGTDVEVYVALEGGRLAAMVRCPDEATFDATALSVALMEYTNKAIPAVIDPETDEVITPAVDASGPLRSAKHVTIAKIGRLVLTPAVLDADGNEITPAVTDPRFHVNFWLGPELVAKNGWKKWAIQWSQYGQDVAAQNSHEAAKILNAIELIDPASISSPANRML